MDAGRRGRDVHFVVARPRPEPATEVAANPSGPVVLAAAASDDPDDATARTTLRLPDSLKARAEAAATAEGLSLNTWLVRAVAAAVEPPPPAPRDSSSAYTGWVR